MDQSSFLFQAMIYLGAAVIFVPVAKRIGLGSILGYLIAGVMIGPFVLGFLGEEGQDIMHFAEFGVVMMLFLIGLELEPEMLWKLRKSILGLGGLQLLLSTLCIGIVALLLNFSWQQSIVLGMIFSLSSTAIVLQTLSEKSQMKTAAGRSSFAVLLFQDIAVIPMLAILPLFAIVTVRENVPGTHEETNWVEDKTGWVRALIVFGSIAAIIIFGRLIIRPLLRAIAKTGVQEIFTAFALLIVTGIAVLMTQVGLSPALGAFLAGVVLANSEYRHELESDIAPFKGLLLGLFFIAVGASVDFKLILENPLQIIGFVLLLMFIKTIILIVLGKAFKLPADQKFIFSFCLSQTGEFAFVLFSFSLQLRIFSEELVSTMIAMVAISMALTPLFILLNEKIILPRLKKESKPGNKADEIHEKNPVIIAGFGHFGNTVGRFLRANKIPATYLDINSDRVNILRKMGFKVFYGDASRYELLQSAGAEEARIIIIAIDSAEKRLEMIQTIKKHFPHLHMLVRATNRYDAYQLMNAGILHIYRETLDTSLRLGVEAMSLLGYRKYTAKRLARTFLKHDEQNMKKLASIQSTDEYVAEARKYIEEIELIIQSDRESKLEVPEGWDAESLRQEAINRDKK